MDKLILKDVNNKSKYSASSLNSESCSCIYCGACVTCVIFAPTVGIFLGTALGLLFTQSNNS